MRCPYCHSDSSRVTDSRGTGNAVRRRRECADCGERFTTLETVVRSILQVVKKDGRREDFDREKLLAGLRSACAKRNVSADQLDAVVADIAGRVTSDGRLEVPSSVIGELAVDALRRIDHIAYIRFASVYRAFADLDSLKDALQALDEGHAPSSDEETGQLALPNEDRQADSGDPEPILRTVG
ncbi:MAG: transcriptional repressor NrdR [Dehalococcoidia bacterium]|nr:transcriptional repressor NrdR [Dehalococcoidia bacterium]MYK26726.1 transcriptional repressor NrdR [Dehalococcoidia bacterium]